MKTILCIIRQWTHRVTWPSVDYFLTFKINCFEKFNLEFSKFLVKKVFDLCFISKKKSSPPCRWSRPGFPINFDPSLILTIISHDKAFFLNKQNVGNNTWRIPGQCWIVVLHFFVSVSFPLIQFECSTSQSRLLLRTPIPQLTLHGDQLLQTGTGGIILS